MTPHSPEAELGLLCSLFLNAVAVFEDGKKLDTSLFHIPAHATIYRVLEQMHRKQVAIDGVSLIVELKKDGTLDQIGSVKTVTEVTSYVPTWANWQFYYETCIEHRRRRQIISACESLAQKAKTSPIEDVFEEAQQQIMDIAQTETREAKGIRELVFEAIEDMESLSQGLKPSGIMTGIRELDRMLGGLKRGEVMVIAGDSGGGKTSLAHQIAINAFVELQIPTLVFSYELKASRVTKRLLCAIGKVSSAAVFLSGKLNEWENQRFNKATATLSGSKLIIEDDPDMNIHELRSVARRHVAKSGVQVIVVDYAQKVPGKADSDEQRIALVSDQVQKMAMELDVAVLLLSQLNDDGKLRQSRTLGFDARTILMIAQTDDSLNRQIKMVKNNNGETGKIDMKFNGPYFTFDPIEA